jgi:hypothetical protein
VYPCDPCTQAALLLGLEQFPEATYLQILYGNFLISIMKDSAMGRAASLRNILVAPKLAC